MSNICTTSRSIGYIYFCHKIPCLALYYTVIDFNEVDIRIYLPEKVIIH